MDSVALQVIVGLVLAYSLLSIVVSNTVEFVRFLLSRRSRFLRAELEKLLTVGKNRAFSNAVLSHPLVKVLDGQGNLNKATTTVQAEHLTAAIMVNAHNIQAEGEQIDQLPRELQSLVQVQGGTNQPEQLVQDWVEKQFAAMTKNFKKYQYWWSFFIGLGFAFLLNIDTLQVAHILWKDPTLRAAVVQTARSTPVPDSAPAEGEDTPDPAAGENAQAAVDDLLASNLPILWVNAPTPIAWIDVAQPTPEADSQTDTHAYFEVGSDPRVWADVWLGGDLGILARKLLGLLLTAIAVSQGADFWFNLLRKLTQREDS